MLCGVGVTRVIPVLSFRWLAIDRATHARPGQAQPLSPIGIIGGGGIANQRASIVIRMLHPRLGTVEGGQRPGGSGALVEFRVHSDLFAAFKVARTVVRAVVPWMSVVTTEISAGAPLALRKDHGLLAEFRVDDQLRDILRRPNVVQQNAGNQVSIGIPAPSKPVQARIWDERRSA